MRLRVRPGNAVLSSPGTARRGHFILSYETPMLDTLTEKLSGVFRNLSGRGRISEENVREAMRDVRTALLEADVNFKVVKDFTDRVQEKALGQEVIRSLQPGQLMVKIVYDELTELMGPVDTRI